MNLDPIPKAGTTNGRKRFWDKTRDVVMSLQKKAGRNVSVDERKGQGTVINVTRENGVITGACCAADGSCSITTESQCEEEEGTYQGDGTVCDPNPCPDCVVSSACHYDALLNCRGTGAGGDGATAWANAISDWMSCPNAPFSCSGDPCFQTAPANGFKSRSGATYQAAAENCVIRFTLDASISGNATVSGNLVVTDSIAGVVDTTPFSFGLTGIGDTHDLTVTPYEPVDPVSDPGNNQTFTTIEITSVDCS